MARKTTKTKDEVDDLDLEEDFDDVDEEEEKKSSAKSKGKKKSKKKDDDKPRGIGAREMAEYLDVEPKTFRAWLRRKQEDGEIEFDDRDPKQRYDFGEDFESKKAQAVIDLYNAELEAREQRKAEREKEKAEKEKEEKASKSKSKSSKSKKS